MEYLFTLYVTRLVKKIRNSGKPAQISETLTIILEETKYVYVN